MQTIKNSRQREKILEMLRNTKSHPSAGEVYDAVREEIPNISLGTVYRNLAKLSDMGQILRLDIGCGTEHFDGDVSPHYHIVCRGCGKITDVFEYAENLNRIAEKHFGGEIESHSLIFFGECEKCLKNI